MTPIVLLVGATLGAGLFVLIRAAMPAQPALSSAVERLTAAPDAAQSPDAEPEGFEERLGAWAERTLTQLPLIITPRRDLALIGWTSRTFYGKKAKAALFGLSLPAILSALAYIAQIPLPVIGSVGAMLVLALVFFLLPDLEVRQRATEERQHYSKVLASYVDFVALSRNGGAGPAQAMTEAASIGDHELFARIRQLIERSRLRGTDAWNDLRDLGEEIGVNDLNEIADIIRLSGEEGASIKDNLHARARSMRNAQLRDEQGVANARSEGMVAPLAILAVTFIALLITPSILNLLSY